MAVYRITNKEAKLFAENNKINLLKSGNKDITASENEETHSKEINLSGTDLAWILNGDFDKNSNNIDDINFENIINFINTPGNIQNLSIKEYFQTFVKQTEYYDKYIKDAYYKAKGNKAGGTTYQDGHDDHVIDRQTNIDNKLDLSGDQSSKFLSWGIKTDNTPLHSNLKINFDKTSREGFIHLQLLGYDNSIVTEVPLNIQSMFEDVGVYKVVNNSFEGYNVDLKGQVGPDSQIVKIGAVNGDYCLIFTYKDSEGKFEFENNIVNMKDMIETYIAQDGLQMIPDPIEEKKQELSVLYDEQQGTAIKNKQLLMNVQEIIGDELNTKATSNIMIFKNDTFTEDKIRFLTPIYSDIEGKTQNFDGIFCI